MPPRRPFGYVVAALVLLSGIVVVGMSVWLGVSGEQHGGADRTAVDRGFPFLVAVVAAVGYAVWLRRSLRDARRADAAAAQRAADAAQVASRTPAGSGPDGSGAQWPIADRPIADRSIPELSPAGREAVDRIVAALADAGVLGPRVPRARELDEGVADMGEPVTVDAVLAALGEQDLRDPRFRRAEHTVNLVFHDSHTEQGVDTLVEQARDLARLAGVPVTIEDAAVADRGTTRLRVAVGDTVRSLDYEGAPKYLSTHLHATVARAIAGTGRRLAWVWSDQGVWITALPGRTGADAVAALNELLGELLVEPWEWVDEQEPVSAGET